MLVALVGTPGAGKSYDAVYEIVNNLRAGRRVYTNIEGMDDPKCQRFLQDLLGMDDYEFKTNFVWMPDKDIEHFWDFKLKDGSLLVIDEVHKRFSNRDWNTEKNKVFADWCSTHRHHGFDVYLVTQDMEKVEKHVRSLIEWTYVYRKVNFLGGLSKNRYLKYAYSGDDTHGKPLNTMTRLYRKEIFNCYKSMVNDTNVKLNIMPQINILKHPVFFAIPLVIGLFLYMFLTKSSFATGDVFGTEKIMHKYDKVKPPTPVTTQQPPTAVVMTPPVQRSMSGAMPRIPAFPGQQTIQNHVNRVVGIIQDGKRTFYLTSIGSVVESKQKLALGSEIH